MVLATEKIQNKPEILSKLMQEYGNAIEFSINYQINSASIKLNKTEESETESDEKEYKNTVKSVEASIESKLLSIDIIKLILNFFIKEGNFKVFKFIYIT